MIYAVQIIAILAALVALVAWADAYKNHRR